MKKESMILYISLLVVLCIVAYKEHSTLASVAAYVVSWLLLIGIAKNVSAWLNRREEIEDNKPL